MMIALHDTAAPSLDDTRKLFYVQNFDWALKMTFRYLGKYKAAVATVDKTFVRLFQSIGKAIEEGDPPGNLTDARWVEEIFIKAAISAGLRGAEQDTSPAREMHVQIYLRELAGREHDVADDSKYRNAIARLLLLPLYQRLVYNICIIDGRSGTEAAGLLGISEMQVAVHLQRARIQLKNAMTGECDPGHMIF